MGKVTCMYVFTPNDAENQASFCSTKLFIPTERWCAKIEWWISEHASEHGGGGVDCCILPWSFSLPRVVPMIFQSQVSRWCCCFWSRGHTKTPLKQTTLGISCFRILTFLDYNDRRENLAGRDSSTHRLSTPSFLPSVSSWASAQMPVGIWAPNLMAHCTVIEVGGHAWTDPT